MYPKEIRIATRKSPLALAQTQLFIKHIEDYGHNAKFQILQIETSGDLNRNWSLSLEGGKGLFTSELERALSNGQADIAIHSAKDMPTEIDDSLPIAGYLLREDPRDALVKISGIEAPSKIATSSPRRRAQGQKLFPRAVWSEIRGNIETRLKKVAAGLCEATFLAVAGLKRLKIDSYRGLDILPIELDSMVPAVGQGAIAVQCVKGQAHFWKKFLDRNTEKAVGIERLFLRKLGGGCHSAFAGHFKDNVLHTFHEDYGYQALALNDQDYNNINPVIDQFIQDLPYNKNG